MTFASFSARVPLLESYGLTVNKKNDDELGVSDRTLTKVHSIL